MTPKLISLARNSMGMKYVQVYKSPDTGWTTFDIMSSGGFRNYVHLVPGEKALEAREQLINKVMTRRVEYVQLAQSYDVITAAMACAASNSYGFIAEDAIEPLSFRARWGLAMFWARNPWLKLPMNWYSIDEVELALRKHYGLAEA